LERFRLVFDFVGLGNPCFLGFHCLVFQTRAFCISCSSFFFFLNSPIAAREKKLAIPYIGLKLPDLRD
jgi:hypothetical protein